MSSPRYARLASQALGEADSAPLPPADPAERARTIAALAQQLATRARSRRRVRWTIGISAVAAIALATLGGARLVHRAAPVAAATASPAAPVSQIIAHPLAGGSSVVVAGAEARPEPLDDGRSVAAGSRVVTPADGRATLSFSTGTSALLHEATALTVAAAGSAQVLRLDSGAVELHVAKLGAGERFVVDTADAEVEVRGTRFVVSLVAPEAACGGGTPTRVSVTEGVVVVRHDGVEDRLVVGDTWPRGCEIATAPPPAGVRRGPARASSGPLVPQPGSTLADQNDLFTFAMTSKRRGDVRGALAAFDRFLADYPGSPLAESALAERMRILHGTASPRSRQAANDYLARYSNGFAHAEAEAILAEKP